MCIEWFFVEFSGKSVQVILDPCWLNLLQNTVLVEKSIRVTAHCLSVPVDQAADLIKEFAVAPDEVEVIDEFLHYGIGRALLPRRQYILTSNLHFQCLEVHWVLYDLRVVGDVKCSPVDRHIEGGGLRVGAQILEEG